MFTVRGEEDKVVGGGKQLFTGVQLLSLKAIGSDIDTLTNELGFKEAKEGQPCVQDDNGDTRLRIDVWLNNDEHGILFKESFFIKRKTRVATSGKTQYTNDVAQFVYNDGGAPTFDWFNKEGVREAYEGEEDFLNFVQSILNSKTGKDGDKIVFDWDKLFTGDLSQLKGLVKAVANNRMYALLSVRKVENDKGVNFYQTMYRKAYERPYNNPHTKFTKELVKPYGEDKNDHQNSLEFQVYAPKTVTVDASTAPAVTAPAW
jgi:hypothetical protein